MSVIGTIVTIVISYHVIKINAHQREINSSQTSWIVIQLYRAVFIRSDNFAETSCIKRSDTWIIMDVNYHERYHSSHDRTIIRRMRTNLIPGQCACRKGKIVCLSVNLRAAGRGVAAANRAHLLSKRGRREREKIHRYIHKTRSGPRGSCVVKPVRFYDRLLPTSKHTHAQRLGRGISAPRAKQRVCTSILSIW